MKLKLKCTIAGLYIVMLQQLWWLASKCTADVDHHDQVANSTMFTFIGSSSVTFFFWFKNKYIQLSIVDKGTQPMTSISRPYPDLHLHILHAQVLTRLAILILQKVPPKFSLILWIAFM